MGLGTAIGLLSPPASRRTLRRKSGGEGGRDRSSEAGRRAWLLTVVPPGVILDLTTSGARVPATGDCRRGAAPEARRSGNNQGRVVGRAFARRGRRSSGLQRSSGPQAGGAGARKAGGRWLGVEEGCPSGTSVQLRRRPAATSSRGEPETFVMTLGHTEDGGYTSAVVESGGLSRRSCRRVPILGCVVCGLRWPCCRLSQ